MSHDTALHALRASLDGLRRKQLSMDAFCRAWRGETALLAALPASYGQVMEDLLGRMEAGSLFTEESCSFSQEDLLGRMEAGSLFTEESCSFSQEDLQANLAVWLDKASRTLEKA
ncbi:hypothetical protein [Noviherbaspirillum galbum]|uniref:Uncharacterized protein n=1 Tax=Noviherbaspirillum galbum TaxID=2709383 RepID=A0A6B3SN93_9BURK|nr:hypothetical protein [Noviherbaspirillum galbum]NEX60755.1 hypothetical protein [Noviherbaspirillum galbum]